ncbi:glycosyltransferase family A protein [Lutibacter maritimus]|uniref:Glycosyl transferase family 2 n=1 Tax=Lutibacter maritimus TaxID=593133 RepID=A0A1I6SP43_9FLAO|nr:glycosyltransferase family A protein [Lutibacter maritimus]SFS78568.1 Glycosyl transferase family 2 [Lutibacter maritimus]
MLAIVIPFFKLIYFNDTLKSLANQTDKRFKVYIGDDASPENPLDLLEHYKGTFDFEYKRFETNLGGLSLTKQWERCIEMIDNEEWIMLLGDDDYLDENVVASWYYNFKNFESKTSVVRFATIVVNEKTNRISKIHKHPIWESSIDSFWRRYEGKTRSTLSEYIFSKNKYLEFGFRNYPLAWHSDDMAWLVFTNAGNIFTINESVVFYRFSEISLSGKKMNQNLKDKASYLFYKDIIEQFLTEFDLNKKLDLILEYEITIKKINILSNNDWYYILKLYMKYFKLIPFLKFVRRFLIDFNKK